MPPADVPGSQGLDEAAPWGEDTDYIYELKDLLVSILTQQRPTGT